MTAAERETGEAILAAAADLFAERGYRGTTTRAIAQRAGVNEVTLFRRFGSKKGLLVALGESWSGSMAGFAVGRLPDPSDTTGTLAALAGLEITQAERFGGAAMRLAMDAQSCPEVAEVLGSGPGQNFAGLAEYLAGRQAAGDLRSDLDPAVMAEVFFAITSSLVMSRQVLGGAANAGHLPIDQLTRQVLEVYLHGVSASGEGR